MLFSWHWGEAAPSGEHLQSGREQLWGPNSSPTPKSEFPQPLSVRKCRLQSSTLKKVRAGNLPLNPIYCNVHRDPELPKQWLYTHRNWLICDLLSADIQGSVVTLEVPLGPRIPHVPARQVLKAQYQISIFPSKRPWPCPPAAHQDPACSPRQPLMEKPKKPSWHLSQAWPVTPGRQGHWPVLGWHLFSKEPSG